MEREQLEEREQREKLRQQRRQRYRELREKKLGLSQIFRQIRREEFQALHRESGEWISITEAARRANAKLEENGLSPVDPKFLWQHIVKEAKYPDFEVRPGNDFKDEARGKTRKERAKLQQSNIEHVGNANFVHESIAGAIVRHYVEKEKREKTINEHFYSSEEAAREVGLGSKQALIPHLKNGFPHSRAELGGFKVYLVPKQFSDGEGKVIPLKQAFANWRETKSIWPKPEEKQEPTPQAPQVPAPIILPKPEEPRLGTKLNLLAPKVVIRPPEPAQPPAPQVPSVKQQEPPAPKEASADPQRKYKPGEWLFYQQLRLISGDRTPQQLADELKAHYGIEFGPTRVDGSQFIAFFEAHKGFNADFINQVREKINPGVTFPLYPAALEHEGRIVSLSWLVKRLPSSTPQMPVVTARKTDYSSWIPGVIAIEHTHKNVAEAEKMLEEAGLHKTHAVVVDQDAYLTMLSRRIERPEKLEEAFERAAGHYVVFKPNLEQKAKTTTIHEFILGRKISSMEDDD